MCYTKDLMVIVFDLQLAEALVYGHEVQTQMDLEDGRMPKKVLYGKLKAGKHPQGKTCKLFNLKDLVKKVNVDTNT